MKKNQDKTPTDKHTIKGHTVEIRKIENREELWIDGVRRKFFVTKDGYNLHDAAYDKPYKSLREAVEHYLENAPNPTGHHNHER